MTLLVPATLNQAIGAVTGYTTPTFTTVASATAPVNGRVSTVTAKGGTQPSAVDVHSASRNFSFLSLRPGVIRGVPPLNAAGQLVGVPINKYSLNVKKGMTCMVNQPSQHGYVQINIGIPAGADLVDPDNVSAMLVAASIAMSQMTQEIINTAKTGEA